MTNITRFTCTRIYLILIHASLVALIFTLGTERIQGRSVTPPDDYIVRASHQRRVAKNIQPDQIIFLGDSMIEGLNTSAIYPGAINFGIGHDRVKWLSARINNYANLKRAKLWVICIGINDLLNSDYEKAQTDLRYLLRQIPQGQQVFISSILPLTSARSLLQNNLNKEVWRFNKFIEKLTETNENIRLLEVPKTLTNKNRDLKSGLDDSDGLHLNKEGYDLWISYIKDQLFKRPFINE